MKRGLITWDQQELPRSALDGRLDLVRKSLAERNLPALVVYADVWRSNHGRYFSNFMAYWNRALLVIPGEGAPVLLCGLSPRVYPWIRSVTILEEIRPAANLAQQLLQMAAEKSWKRIGVLDLTRLPYDLHAPICAGVECADVPSGAIRPAPDPWELTMYRRAARLARAILADQLPSGAGLVDHEFVGRLERSFRRAGAEDLIILLTNGATPPVPPRGAVLAGHFSVTVALEYRGHWVRLSRSADAPESLRKHFESALKNPVQTENLSGPYPYETGLGPLFVLHVELPHNQRRLFYGDTCCQGVNGAELL